MLPVVSLVEVWSFALDLGQIWCWIELLFPALLLWRSELGVVQMSIGVSYNKALVAKVSVPPGQVLAGRRGGGRRSGPVAAKSSWEAWVAALWSFCAAAMACCRDLGPMRRPLHIVAGSVFLGGMDAVDPDGRKAAAPALVAGSRCCCFQGFLLAKGDLLPPGRCAVLEALLLRSGVLPPQRPKWPSPRWCCGWPWSNAMSWDRWRRSWDKPWT